ncbi:tripartite motif-containing protein 2-like [Argopecten irradians]|uniref:tripartite motif-containing protein 2-like n=1 Tax=Argopecten irradians TaxID=31199 RepID=UPI00371C2F65
MAAPIVGGQTALRIKGQTTCVYHKGKQLELYCKQCQKLACIKCLSTIHESHPLCDLDEIIPEKKRSIQNFVDRSENVDLVQVKHRISSTNIRLLENTREFATFSKQLMMQTEKLKDKLDVLTGETLSLYKQMEEDNAKLLENYKHELEKYSTELKLKVRECKTALQNGSSVEIFDTERDAVSLKTQLVNPTLGTATFCPNQNPADNLKKALGIVRTSGQERASSSDSQRLSTTPKRSPVQYRKPALKDTIPRRAASPKLRLPLNKDTYSLLGQGKIVGDLKVPFNVKSICPTLDDQAWTSNYDSDNITLIDKNCKVIQKIKHTTGICDISLSLSTNTLWVCDWKNNISELVSGRLLHRFRASKAETAQCTCVCATASGHVILGMNKSICKFTANGQMTRKGEMSMCSPARITECPVTHNIAFADLDMKHDDGQGKPRVVVTDTELKEIFIFNGVTYNLQSPYKSEGLPFFPCGLVFDVAGNLIIGDGDRRNVIVISGSGKFLRQIHTDARCTVAVGLGGDGVIWAIFGGGNVKRLQYRL